MRKGLIWDLNDQDADVRAAAVSTIAASGSRRLHPALLLAVGDPAVWVRCLAVEAIREYRSPLAQLALEWALDDDSDSVRMRAVEGLGGLRNRRSVQAVVGACNDPSRFVRASAAEALGYIGGPNELPCLLGLFRDRSWLVRGWAAAALGEIRVGVRTKRKIREVLSTALPAERSSFVRLSILDGLFRLGEAWALQRLLPFLESKAAHSRRVAANILVGLAEDGLLGDATVPIRCRLEQALQSEADANTKEVMQEALERFCHASTALPAVEA